jgi:hypothetical protein
VPPALPDAEAEAELLLFGVRLKRMNHFSESKSYRSGGGDIERRRAK